MATAMAERLTTKENKKEVLKMFLKKANCLGHST